MVSLMNIHTYTTCTNRHSTIRGQFSQVVKKVSLMTFMNRQHSLSMVSIMNIIYIYIIYYYYMNRQHSLSMVSIMNIHGRRIVRLVNTLDDFYQAVVLGNQHNNTREKIQFFFTCVWNSQSVTDTSLAFGTSRSGWWMAKPSPFSIQEVCRNFHGLWRLKHWKIRTSLTDSDVKTFLEGEKTNTRKEKPKVTYS